MTLDRQARWHDAESGEKGDGRREMTSLHDWFFLYASGKK